MARWSESRLVALAEIKSDLLKKARSKGRRMGFWFSCSLVAGATLLFTRSWQGGSPDTIFLGSVLATSVIVAAMGTFLGWRDAGAEREKLELVAVC